MHIIDWFIVILLIVIFNNFNWLRLDRVNVKVVCFSISITIDHRDENTQWI